MENLINGGKNYKSTEYSDDVRKSINNLKKYINKDLKYKVRDRGDSVQIKDKIEVKNVTNITSMRHFVKKVEKRDVNICNNERKRDNSIQKTNNMETESKSKNILEIKENVNKDSKITEELIKNSETTKSNIKIDKTKIDKKPLIKTIKDTDNAKTYKTIAFSERKQQKSLQIKLPKFVNDDRTRIPKLINKINKTNTEDKANSKRNFKEKKLKLKRDFSSPLRFENGGSPPTEVSKWTPRVSDHSNYYEAWVKTTLAAMSNKKKRQYNRPTKAFELRSKSPDLFYENFADERFTGRIKINHR